MSNTSSGEINPNKNHYTQWFNRNRLLITFLFTSFVLLITAWYIDNRNNEAHLQASRIDVQSKLGGMRARLEGKLNSNIQMVYGLVSAIGVEPNMDQKRFSQFAKPLFERDSQLRNIGGAPNMTIKFTYPLEGNEAAIGLNYLENEKQRSGAIIARDTGQLVLAGPVNLVQGGKGFIGRIPVFSDNITEGKREFWGLISAVIDSDKLYEASGLLDPELDIDIAIFGQDKRFSNGKIFFGDKAIFTKEPIVSLIELPFGYWQLSAIPKGGWPSLADDYIKFRFYLLIASLSVLTPIMLFAWISNRHREQQTNIDTLFKLSPIGILLTEFDSGKIILSNEQFLKDTNLPHNQIKNISFWDLINDSDRNRYRKKLESIDEVGHFNPFEIDVLGKGKQYPATISGVVIQNSKGKNLVWSYIRNITQDINNKKRLIENNQQLELVINATQVGIWDWQVQTGDLKLNNRWAEIIGYNLEELGEISINTWKEHAHPDDLKKSEELLQKHWDRQSDQYIFEARMKHKEGHYIWILDTGKVIEWGENGKPKRMVGTHLDITDKKISEEKIEKANNSLAQQMRLIKTIVKNQGEFISHTDGNFEYSNILQDLMSLTYSSQSFIGHITNNHDKTIFNLDKYCWNTISVKEQEYIEKNLNSSFYIDDNNNEIIKCANLESPLFFNEFSDINKIKLFPKSHQIINNICLIPIIHNHKTISVIGLMNSEKPFNHNVVHWLIPLINTVGQIIESVNIVKEKKRTEKLLIEAKNQAESAGNAKTEFLATMSHEIRTPMNGVIGMLNLLQKSGLNREQNKQLEMAKTSADTLLTVINDILDFTKMDSGKLKLEKLPFNIRDMIDDICQSMAFKPHEKGIEIILDLSHIEHENIISDPIRIKQVLINLIGNAIKFTEKGSITIQAKTQLKDENLILYCSIIDTGVGIKKEKLTRLFEAFTQADNSTTRKFGGTGLGLSICKRICNTMNGNIWVNSEYGKGSNFSFEIPVGNQNIENAHSLLKNISDSKICILDENIDNCITFQSQLQSWGNQSQYFNTQQKILELFINHQDFDYMFIDYEVLQNVRSEFETFKENINQDSTLILMTKVNQTIDKETLVSLGFDFNFPKPITKQDLIDSLNIKHNKAPSTQTHKDLETVSKFSEKIHCLLVEDIPFNQEVASMILAEMGLTPDIANNGKEAVDIIESMKIEESPYDIILMDCQMPVMDGYEATREIKNLCKNKGIDIPIVAMTANAMSDDKDKCIAAGMDDYLSKPIDESKLFLMIKKWANKQRTH